MHETRPLRHIRHLSDRARWELTVGDPAPALADDVLSYRGYVEHAAPSLRRREVPTAEIVLVLQLDAKLRMTDPRSPDVTEEVGCSFVAALSDTYTVTELGPGWTGLQVNLSPPGAYTLFGVPMHELANRVIELEDVLGAAGRRLTERIGEAGGWAERFAVLDAFLAERLRSGPTPSTQVVRAWERLQDRPGTDIRSLAEEVGWSRKHLIASFREQIGLGPKRVARLLRFRRAVRILDGTTAPDWTDLAYRCGYCDQSHMIREFREFAGAAPREFLRRMLPDGGGVGEDPGDG